MAGVAAAQWGGPSSGIEGVVIEKKERETYQAVYNLVGCRVPLGTKGLLIVDGKKRFCK